MVTLTALIIKSNDAFIIGDVNEPVLDCMQTGRDRTRYLPHYDLNDSPIIIHRLEINDKL